MPRITKRVLAISSQVTRGHIGLSAIAPTLTLLGIDVMPMPTVLLSNHPGHRHSASTITPVADLKAQVTALADNGWLDVDAVLTGYLPTEDHVRFAAETIDLVKRLAANRKVSILCDPVIGDDPKGIYIDSSAAHAIRNHLIAKADIITPNRFELSWLSGREVTSFADAAIAARSLTAPLTIATSIPDRERGNGNISVTQASAKVAVFDARGGVPHGTGDTFSAIYLAHHI